MNKELKNDIFTISSIHNNFYRNLDSIIEFVKSVSPITKKIDKVSMERMKYINKELNSIIHSAANKVHDRKTSTIKIRLSLEQYNRFKAIWESNADVKPPHSIILYKSSFIMLISYLDFLISDLIHFYFQSFPESVSNDLSIKLGDLILCSNLEDAIRNISSEEIDKILFNNLNYQKKFFKEKFKIDLKENIIKWDLINEAIERRNIIIHNNCKVNKRYLNSINLDLIPEKKKLLKEGIELTVNYDYFINIYYEVLLCGTILIQCCFRKWDKNSIEKADDFLMQDMYEILLKEKWELAERLGLIIKENDCLKTISNNAIKLVLFINYCQALKWQNKNSELEKELSNIDTSSLSPKFILGVSALKDDEKTFYENIENAIIVDNMTKDYFEEWPIFRNFRKNPEYMNRIQKVFKKIDKK